MCVVNKQFELLEFLFPSYVDLQYDEISLNFIVVNVSLYCVCSHVSCLVCLGGCRGTICGCSGCCVYAVCLLCALHVCMIRKCEGARVTTMLVWGMEGGCLWRVHETWVVHVVQVMCLAQLNLLGMSVVRWRRGVVECVRCVCLTRGGGKERE